MLIDENFGPYFPKHSWFPMPAYLLRRRLILSNLKNSPKGKVLDIGCGMASLLHELKLKNFNCTGFDISKETLDIVESCQELQQDKIALFETEQSDWLNNFDYIFAFEVLEHISEDEVELKKFVRWLKPGGAFFLSVPNHVKNWGELDEVAGHVRRYELKDLIQLCKKVDLEIEFISAYGFPLNNLCSMVRNLILRRNRKKPINFQSVEDRIQEREVNNLKSARITNYPRLFKFMRTPIGLFSMNFFYLMQDVTQKYNLGNGIIVKAKKIG